MDEDTYEKRAKAGATTSDLCNLVAWAHTHGMICKKMPTLEVIHNKENVPRGKSALWLCEAGHAYNWPCGPLAYKLMEEQASSQGTQKRGSAASFWQKQDDPKKKFKSAPLVETTHKGTGSMESQNPSIKQKPERRAEVTSVLVQTSSQKECLSTVTFQTSSTSSLPCSVIQIPNQEVSAGAQGVKASQNIQGSFGVKPMDECYIGNQGGGLNPQVIIIDTVESDADSGEKVPESPSIDSGVPENISISRPQKNPPESNKSRPKHLEDNSKEDDLPGPMMATKAPPLHSKPSGLGSKLHCGYSDNQPSPSGMRSSKDSSSFSKSPSSPLQPHIVKVISLKNEPQWASWFDNPDEDEPPPLPLSCFGSLSSDNKVSGNVSTSESAGKAARKKTKSMTEIKMFRDWLKRTKPSETREICTIPPAELNQLLMSFFNEIRKQNGTEFSASSLYFFQSSIDKYLKKQNYKCSIIKGPEFQGSQKILKGKVRQLLFNEKQRDWKMLQNLTDEDMASLRKAGVLSRLHPEGLLNLMILNIVRGFGALQCFQNVTVTWGQIILKKRGNLEILEWHGDENPSPDKKNYITEKPESPEDCPILDYKEYSRKRPLDMLSCNSPFYLAPKPVCSVCDQIWFSKKSLLKTKVKKLLKTLLQHIKRGLSK
ncbi:uncharacterized protein KIAA1958-like [Ornithorhynchus anatinus]|uniref:Uncharacterized protein n=1 Tax=Ornithorhynchus anatinus TaxID=9258 RepID=A0A6I8NIZ8_ORNAN|nr:uncharacterized protein KIAA1958-like [Ornithorhynchus anatinus]